jgi:hypothetical protein
MASKKSSKPNRTVTAVSIGAAVVAIGGAIVAIFARRGGAGSAEHPAPDLALDQPHPGPEHRAPVDFRPDPTAPVPPGERDALRPATGTAPSLVEDRGMMNSATASANG